MSDNSNILLEVVAYRTVYLHRSILFVHPVEDSMVAGNYYNNISNNPTNMLPVSIRHSLLNLMVDYSLYLRMKGSMKRDILEK